MAARSADLRADRLVEVCAEGAARSRAAGDATLELLHALTGTLLRALLGQTEEAEVIAEQALNQAAAIGATREAARAYLADHGSQPAPR